MFNVADAVREDKLCCLKSIEKAFVKGSQGNLSLSHFGTSMKDCKEVVLAATMKYPPAFTGAGPTMKQDRDCVLAAIEGNANWKWQEHYHGDWSRTWMGIIKEAGPSLQNDKGVARAAIDIRWEAIQCLGPK